MLGTALSMPDRDCQRQESDASEATESLFGEPWTFSCLDKPTDELNSEDRGYRPTNSRCLDKPSQFSPDTEALPFGNPILTGWRAFYILIT